MPARATRDYVVRLATWENDRLQIQRVRRSVFIEEQRIAERDEWDELDPVIPHVLVFEPPASAKRDAVGTGRLEPTGKIGRVAVLPQYRGTGAGVAVMRRLMDPPAGAGMVARARGRRIAAWKLTHGWAGEVSRADSVWAHRHKADSLGPVEEVRLVPYGCTRIRITEFPRVDSEA